LKRFVEVGGENRIRLRFWDVGAGLTEIIVDGDRALIEEQLDPRRCSGKPIGGGIGRVGGDRRLERGEGLIMVEVITEFEAPRPQVFGILRQEWG
jgi:hypothetical protein